MMRWTLGAGMTRPTWMIHRKNIVADDVCAGTGADDDADSIICGCLHPPFWEDRAKSWRFMHC